MANIKYEAIKMMVSKPSYNRPVIEDHGIQIFAKILIGYMSERDTKINLY